MKVCCRCRASHSRYGNVCSSCSSRRYLLRRYLSGARFCQAEVAKARNRGDLTPPSCLPCADCAGAASEYDHRDYSHALIVEPVCRGCNRRRGSARPRTWAPGEWDRYVERMRTTKNTKQPNLIRLFDAAGASWVELRPDLYHTPAEARA